MQTTISYLLWARQSSNPRNLARTNAGLFTARSSNPRVVSTPMKPFDEIAQKAFRIPKRHVITGYLITTAVLAIGTWLSIQLDDWMWLARFGAFLVCLAMMFEVTGVLERYVKNIFGVVEGATVDVVLMQVNRRPHLYGVSSETTTQQIQEIAEKEQKRRLKYADDLMRNAIARKVQKHEFILASIGTLLWAFADLLNKL